MSVDAVCQEGVFVVENVSYYNDAKLATDLSPEADWKRRGLYIGPQVRSPTLFLSLRGSTRLTLYLSCFRQFETLDLNFQEEFEKFLQERGIDESLAFFVPEYAQHKEQKVETFAILSFALMVDDFCVIIGICQMARKNQELR